MDPKWNQTVNKSEPNQIHTGTKKEPNRNQNLTKMEPNRNLKEPDRKQKAFYLNLYLFKNQFILYTVNPELKNPGELNNLFHNAPVKKL